MALVQMLPGLPCTSTLFFNQSKSLGSKGLAEQNIDRGVLSLLASVPAVRSKFRPGVRSKAQDPGRKNPEQVSVQKRPVRANATEGAQRLGEAANVSGVATAGEERTALDAAMGGLSFGELCNEFECISSPAVEATARQLARDILELRENRRQLSNYAVFVKYKDPLRSFTGREKYKRPSWLLDAVDKPTAAILQMVMRGPGVLNIRWRVKGRLRFPPAALAAGDLVLTVSSTFTLNQISGQVVEHRDEWNLGGSSPPAAAYYWASRLAWTVNEAGKDASDAFKAVFRFLDRRDDMGNIYADPTDPRKFFQETNPNSELYQIGLVVALLYLLVSFLRLVL